MRVDFVQNGTTVIKTIDGGAGGQVEYEGADINALASDYFNPGNIVTVNGSIVYPQAARDDQMMTTYLIIFVIIVLGYTILKK